MTIEDVAEVARTEVVQGERGKTKRVQRGSRGGVRERLPGAEISRGAKFQINNIMVIINL